MKWSDVSKNIPFWSCSAQQNSALLFLNLTFWAFVEKCIIHVLSLDIGFLRNLPAEMCHKLDSTQWHGWNKSSLEWWMEGLIVSATVYCV